MVSKLIHIRLAVLLFAVFFSATGFAVTKKANPLKLTGAILDLAAGQNERLITVEELEQKKPKLSEIRTQWSGGEPHTYQGIPLKEFVALYGTPGVSAIKVAAVDDYTQTLSKIDWDDRGALLAFREDGELISARKKGPFRIIYDYDKFQQDSQVRTMVRNNSIWQIRQIEFLKK